MRFYAPLDHEPKPDLLAIEVATSLQIPSFHIIGLPAPEVSEARERIRAAIENSGLKFPKRRLIVNLSPASVRKRGTGLDLAIALAVLADGKSSLKERSSIVATGELGLDGRVRSAGGVTRTLHAAWANGAQAVLLPEDDMAAGEAGIRLIRQATPFIHPCPSLISVSHLQDAWREVAGEVAPVRQEERAPSPPLSRIPSHMNGFVPESLLPLSPMLERVILCASAGLHHVLLLGPKGSGKSYAMNWLEALQPERSPALQLHHQLLSELKAIETSPMQPRLPVRRVSPHVRPHSLVGSTRGMAVRPGEYSLAHGGLFIADEFPEWPRDSRESLRGPLETGVVAIPGAPGNPELPARFLFAATGNLCPCGGWPRDLPLPEAVALPGAALPVFCSCSPMNRRQYRSRVSGPVLDRIDLAMIVTTGALPGERTVSFEMLRSRIENVRTELKHRWGDLPGLLSASQTEELLHSHRAHREWESWLAATRVASLRSRHKVIRIALTLAALDGRETPGPAHFAEAAFYRPESVLL